MLRIPTAIADNSRRLAASVEFLGNRRVLAEARQDSEIRSGIEKTAGSAARRKLVGDLSRVSGIPEEVIADRVPEHIPPGFDVGRMFVEAANMSPLEYYNSVRGHGKWDFKQLDPKYQDFGNWAYGVSAYAVSRGVIPLGVFLRFAGWANQRADPEKRASMPGRWYSAAPYGDDEKDQMWIQNSWYINEEASSYQPPESRAPIRLEAPTVDVSAPQ